MIATRHRRILVALVATLALGAQSAGAALGHSSALRTPAPTVVHAAKGHHAGPVGAHAARIGRGKAFR